VKNKTANKMRKTALILINILLMLSVYGQNIEKDIRQGEESNKAIIAQIGIYDHPAIKNLEAVGEQLVSHLEERKFDYQFAILDMQDPNAMALPGGYVYFSRGLLVLVNSEDELAGVMGHEITHVHDQHSRKSQNRSIFSSIFMIPGAIVGVFLPKAGGLLIAPVALYNSGYSRSNEKSADLNGAKLAAASGFDPNGLTEILDKISKELTLETGSEERSSWLDSHPYTPKRVDELNKYIPKLNYEKQNISPEEHKAFIMNLEGIVIGDDPKGGIFQNGTFLHPEMNFAFSYPKDWTAINSPVSLAIVSPDKEAQLALQLEDTAKDPSEYAMSFMREYSKRNSPPPFRNEAIKVNDFPAHILQFESMSRDTKYIASVLWLTRDGRTYQFVEISNEAQSDVLVETVKSLHGLTEEERNTIYKTSIHIVQAKEGETIGKLSERTGNSLDLEFTALINNLAVDTTLSSSDWLKIGVKEKY
jgi:predicted Zn-dependent protease